MQEHLDADHEVDGHKNEDILIRNEEDEVESEDGVMSSSTHEHYRPLGRKELGQINCSKKDLAEALEQLKKELQTLKSVVKEPRLVDPEYFEGD